MRELHRLLTPSEFWPCHCYAFASLVPACQLSFALYPAQTLLALCLITESNMGVNCSNQIFPLQMFDLKFSLSRWRGPEENWHSYTCRDPLLGFQGSTPVSEPRELFVRDTHCCLSAGFLMTIFLPKSCGSQFAEAH